MSFQARADELLQGVAATNWRSELMAFSREVGDESATLQAKAEEGLEGVMEGLEKVLPDQVGRGIICMLFGPDSETPLCTTSVIATLVVTPCQTSNKVKATTRASPSASDLGVQ